MIQKFITIILLLSSTTAFAADQSAAIPNSRILNEDAASAREKVNAFSLGKMEEDAALQTEVMRAAILEDLARSQPRPKKISVAENYGLIFEKVKQAVHNGMRSQRALWIRTEKFLEEANDPSQWNIPEDERDDVLRYSLMTDEELKTEIEKKFTLTRYTLTGMDWDLFQRDFAGNFIGRIILYEGLIADYDYRYKHEGGNSIFLELIKSNQEQRKSDLKKLLIFREWVYRHWDDSVRPRSVKISRGAASPMVAGSLGSSDPKVTPVIVEEYYQSIYGKVVAHIAVTPQRAEIKNAWMFTKRFLEEAENPSLWLAKETPTEAADTKRFAHMTTWELEAEFKRYYPFSYYNLRTLKWEHFRADTVGNFMNGILVSRQILREEGFTSQEREPYLHNAIAGQIFREWVYRHWNATRRPASYMLFPSGASLGRITPSPVAESYEFIRAKVEEDAVSENKKLTELEDSYLKGLGLVMDGKLSTKELQQRKLAIASQRFHNKKYAYAKDFFDKALNPSPWMKEETPSERKETDDFSKMSNEELKNKFSEQYAFANYSLEGITAEIFLGDTLPNFLYGALWLLEKSHQAMGTYVSKTPAQRIFREWVYRHWNHEPKEPSYTFFDENFQPVQQASSLGKQALVFQMNSGLNKEVLDKTAELMRSNPDKSVIFVVGRRSEGDAVRKALKVRGLNVTGVPFEVNPLRTPGDSERFTKYVRGLQAKFPEKNGVAVIADFAVLSELSSKNIISIARDKAGKGSHLAPANIANIQNIEREGTDSVLFNLAWNILSSSGPEKFLDQIERDAATGVFFIRLDSLKSLLEHWLSEHKTAQALLTAA